MAAPDITVVTILSAYRAWCPRCSALLRILLIPRLAIAVYNYHIIQRVVNHIPLYSRSKSGKALASAVGALFALTFQAAPRLSLARENFDDALQAQRRRRYVGVYVAHATR